ncbi:MAG TPA: GNVR domain-containing protein [Syntrophales bacterium]|nr:GNVR domain-containing protein [Syntrophales bacterium]
MINPNKVFNIDDYKEIVLRRLPYIIIPFVVIFVGAVLYAFLAPKTYEAKTLILVTPQRVPTDFVKPTVTSRVTERLASIEQEIKSRTSLEQIIRDNNLYPKQTKAMPMEDVVGMMRNDINVQIQRTPESRDAGGYFTIAYSSSDPRTAATITNRLADLFIEGNLRIREQQAKGTTEFLKDELDSAKAKLEEQEKLLTDFKRKHTGELPEQRDTNLQMLTQLQQIYQRTGENLRSAQDRKLIIQKQLTDLEFPVTSVQAERGQQSTGRLPSSSSNAEHGGIQEPQLYELKNQLADLRTKYTEKHPDIVRIKKRIREMESNQDLDFRNNPRYRELNSQMQAVNVEITRLQAEEAKLKGEIDKYSGRIERTATREQDMSSLTREYHSTKETYESLLKKSQEAEQAENLERRQKGEQFRVIDAAAVPVSPAKPNRERIMLMGLMLGLGSGLGLAFVREQMDRSFHDPEDVEVTFGIKILASIPRIVEKTDKAA